MKTIVKQLIPNAGTLILVGLLFLAQSAGALPSAAPASTLAPSQTLTSYQGTLTDTTGNPLIATVTMKFALYDALTGGALKWGIETQTVQVANGLFHVLLGSVTPIDPATLTGDLWLDIKVNGEQLTPRERITSVVYAAEAGTLPDGAETQGRLQVNGNLTVDSPDSGIYSVQLARIDEENRTHRWVFWHMNEQFGMNSLQLWEYRTDSTGKDCGGDLADGAMCSQRAVMAPGATCTSALLPVET